MKPTQLGWTAFIVAIAGLTTPPAAQAIDAPPSNQTNNSNGVESRLARIQSTLKNSGADFNPQEIPQNPPKTALGWGNGRGGGTFVNSRRGGWGDGRGGRGFANINPWRNGWGDRGGFYNRGWPNGGFVNRW